MVFFKPGWRNALTSLMLRVFIETDVSQSPWEDKFDRGKGSVIFACPNVKFGIHTRRRDVAQPGRAQRSGRWGRWFKSSRPDHQTSTRPQNFTALDDLLYAATLPGAMHLPYEALANQIFPVSVIQSEAKNPMIR